MWNAIQERKPRAAKNDIAPGAAELARRRLGFEPDELQALVLESKAKRRILNCSRQVGEIDGGGGKGGASGVRSAGMSGAGGESRGTAERGVFAQRFVRNASGMMAKAGVAPRGDGDNPISLVLPNRSRIVGLPGTEATVRGFSAVSLLLIDGAARVEDAMYKALRPILAVGLGDLWLMSTPWGKRGFFYEAWEHSGSE